ncbi:MAG: FtsW/RodA/SpoVE family cell cycle protein [Oscillospiraceae bacterium]|nr:FtsW/RodA/SpoVE family cell cycle protein [Oscillospiraceae bacterium]
MKRILGMSVAYIKKTDRVLLIACIALSFCSVILLAGILNTDYVALLRFDQRSFLVQCAAVGLGIIFAVSLSFIDYEILVKSWKFHYALCYLAVFATFFFGVGAEGRLEDKRWLSVPFVGATVQPTEFLKISFILTFAYHIYFVHKELNHPKNILLLFMHGAFPVLLIHLQGDDGTALSISIIFLCMLIICGLNWKYIVGIAAVAAAAIPVFWTYILQDFQKLRILALITSLDENNLSETAANQLREYMYQQQQARMAMGTGELFGKGVFSGDHVHVPEIHSDFIFSFLAESLGLAGALVFIVVMLTLCLRLLYNAIQCADIQGKAVFAGIFAMFAFPAVYNLGMCVSLFPVMGNPMPFLSYGGSSMLANFIALGTALSVYIHKKRMIR